MEKHIFIILILIAGLTTNKLAAQSGYDLHTDSLSLQLYEKQRWEALYDLVQSSLNQDVDFYYLYVRGALASFYTGRYVSANDLFNRASSYQLGSDYVREMHYLSALYAQLPLSIEKTYSVLSAEAKKRYDAPQYQALQYLGLLGGYNINKDVDQLKDVENQGVYSDRILFKHLQFTDVYMGYQLSPRWSIHQAVERLSATKSQDALTQNALTGMMDAHQQDIQTTQWSYNANVWFNVNDKLYLYPFFSILNYHSNYLHIAYDENTYDYATSNKAIEETQYLYGLGLKIRQEFLNWECSASRLNTERGDVFQSVVRVNYLPIKGKPHYISATWNRMNRSQAIDEDFTHHVLQAKVGLNIKKSWLSLSYATGNHLLMMDNYGATIYNTYEEITDISALNFAHPLSKQLWLSLNYKYITYQSKHYFADLTSGLYSIPFTHHNHSISGGLTWYF